MNINNKNKKYKLLNILNNNNETTKIILVKPMEVCKHFFNKNILNINMLTLINFLENGTKINILVNWCF